MAKDLPAEAGQPKLLVVTFIAGAEPEAHDAAEKAMQEFQLVNRCASCERRPDALEIMVAKTNFWTPYVYAALKTRLANTPVVLDPGIFALDARRQLILKTTIEPNLATQRIFYILYVQPTGNGLATPRTTANWTSGYAQPISASSATGLNLDWLKLWSEIAAHSHQMINGVATADVFRKIMTEGPSVATGGGADKIAARLADNLSVGGLDLPTRLRNYNEIINIPSLSADTTLKLLDAEIAFRKDRSDKLSAYLVDSDYGKSLHAIADAEWHQRKQEWASAFVMAAGSVAGGLSSAAKGEGFAGGMNVISSSNIKAISASGAAEEKMQEASVPLTAVQLQVSSRNILSQSTISARTITDLRAKMRDIVESH